MHDNPNLPVVKIHVMTKSRNLCLIWQNTDVIRGHSWPRFAAFHDSKYYITLTVCSIDEIVIEPKSRPIFQSCLGFFVPYLERLVNLFATPPYYLLPVSLQAHRSNFVAWIYGRVHERQATYQIQCAPHKVIFHTRTVLCSTATNQNNTVLLDIMTCRNKSQKKKKPLKLSTKSKNQ